MLSGRAPSESAGPTRRRRRATVLLTGIGLWTVDVSLPPAFAAGLLVVVFDVGPGRYLLTAAAGGGALTVTALGLHLLVDHGGD